MSDSNLSGRRMIMSLVKMKELLERAQKNNIGCGAFSVGNKMCIRDRPDTCNSQKIRECHKADNQEKECPQKGKNSRNFSIG